MAHGAVPSEVRLDQVLNRLAADSIRPPRNSSRTRFANELTDSYRRARTGEAGRVTEDQSEPEVHFAPEVRLSGLQRLAQRGINIRTKRAVETERSAKADDGWRGIDEVANLLPVASGDAAEFGLQLVELLRREALRHGISL